MLEPCAGNTKLCKVLLEFADGLQQAKKKIHEFHACAVGRWHVQGGQCWARRAVRKCVAAKRAPRRIVMRWWVEAAAKPPRLCAPIRSRGTSALKILYGRWQVCDSNKSSCSSCTRSRSHACDGVDAGLGRAGGEPAVPGNCLAVWAHFLLWSRDDPCHVNSDCRP